MTVSKESFDNAAGTLIDLYRDIFRFADPKREFGRAINALFVYTQLIDWPEMERRAAEEAIMNAEASDEERAAAGLAIALERIGRPLKGGFPLDLKGRPDLMAIDIRVLCFGRRINVALNRKGVSKIAQLLTVSARELQVRFRLTGKSVHKIRQQLRPLKLAGEVA